MNIHSTSVECRACLQQLSQPSLLYVESDNISMITLVAGRPTCGKWRGHAASCSFKVRLRSGYGWGPSLTLVQSATSEPVFRWTKPDKHSAVQRQRALQPDNIHTTFTIVLDRWRHYYTGRTPLQHTTN